MKEFTIKVNGLEQSTENLGKLSDNLDKVDVKMKDISVSAKDVADNYKKDFQDVMESVVVQISKIGIIITELNAHVNQALTKNMEAVEKTAENIEKSGESSLSSIKLKAIEASGIVEAGIKRVVNQTEEQSTKLSEQVEKNKELLERSTEINKEFSEKDKEIGILNLKAHKENIQTRIDEQKKLKAELEAATVYTSMQYDVLSLQYDKDSEEFKKVQEEKAAALVSLQKKIEEVNTSIKEYSSSYIGVLKKQHAEIKNNIETLHKDIGKNVTEVSNKVADRFDDEAKKIDNYIKSYTTATTEIQKGLKAIDEEEKKSTNKKYDDKLAKLENERKKLRENTDIAAQKKILADAEAEKEAAALKKAEYDNKIVVIKKSFGIKDDKEEGKDATSDAVANKNNTQVNDNTDDKTNDKKDKDKDERIIEVRDATEEEKNAADNKIKELQDLADAEAKIIDEKKIAIANANNAIIVSERAVLVEEMSIDEKKAKLEAERTKRIKEIDAREQKRKEKLAKIEKIKEKAELVKDIGLATAGIAKGIALAWAKGPILGPALAVLVAIQGAMQLKAMTQQLAKFEDGGLLRGKRHAQGGLRIEGTNIEVEGGEYVVNRESTSKNLGLVRYINSQRKELTPMDVTSFFAKASQGYEPAFSRMFESGGQVPAIDTSSTVDNDALIDAIKSIKIAPRVAVTDIIRAQDEAVQVDGWTGV